MDTYCFYTGVACGFPSPLGVSYFQISKEFFFRNLFHNVFPSPLGVSYFQISLKVCKRCLLLLKKFPSPLGVSYFQICKLSHYNSPFLNRFRPLSGYLISKFKYWILCNIVSLLMFPSPLGVSYFQMQDSVFYDGMALGSFRPLSGYLISKSKRWIPKENESGFRPLSGYLISKFWLWLQRSSHYYSFRPLSGYLISKYMFSFNETFADFTVSVPSRGILFPNLITASS